MSRLEEELKIVREVYNSTLERNWGFIPISMDDLLAAADDMKAFADPEMMLIAEIEGENAGVALSLPNFNEILARIKKTPHSAEIAAHLLVDENPPDRLACGRSFTELLRGFVIAGCMRGFFTSSLSAPSSGTPMRRSAGSRKATPRSSRIPSWSGRFSSRSGGSMRNRSL